MEEKDVNLKTRKKIRFLGKVFLLVGVGSFIFGIYSISNGKDGLIFLIPLGIILIFPGAVLLMLGYMSSMARYQMNEMNPVAKDSVNYMIGETKESIVGLTDDIKGNKKIKCPKCNELNDIDAKFCDNCGTPLVKVCTCGALNKPDAKFCDECGKRL